MKHSEDSKGQTRFRIAAFLVAIATITISVFLSGRIPPQFMAALGVIGFLAVAASASANPRLIPWKTVFWGITIQMGFAVLVLRIPAGYYTFEWLTNMASAFLDYGKVGTKFVFGSLADDEATKKAFGSGVPFFISVLPTIIFVSSFFTILYHLGILQAIVRTMAWGMEKLLGTSGAETLSAAANIFMGQTEAPLVIKPYIEKMTMSELLAMMAGGMATVSAALLVIYIGMYQNIGADPIGILCTSVMAAPCSLYLTKMVLPETEVPQTRAGKVISPPSTHANVIDAASGGASDGLMLMLNVGAMLIAFLGLIALCDGLFDQARLGLIRLGISFEGPWNLGGMMSWVMRPVALLMGVIPEDSPRVGELLGAKLVANEFVAFLMLQGEGFATLDPRSKTLVAFALTGFANLSSIGIQIGGIGALAPSRRSDLARLAPRALLVGFLATLINAAMAGILL
jgi:CNT family concentrative nucleoside transporter